MSTVSDAGVTISNAAAWRSKNERLPPRRSQSWHLPVFFLSLQEIMPRLATNVP